MLRHSGGMSVSGGGGILVNEPFVDGGNKSYARIRNEDDRQKNGDKA